MKDNRHYPDAFYMIEDTPRFFVPADIEYWPKAVKYIRVDHCLKAMQWVRDNKKQSVGEMMKYLERFADDFKD